MVPTSRGGIGVEAGTCSLGKSGVIILPRRDNDIKISVTKAGPPWLAAPFFCGPYPAMPVPGYRRRLDGASLPVMPEHLRSAGITRP